MNIRARSTFQAGNFARFEAALVPKIIAAVDNATAAVLATSQQLVPVDTGDLVSSGGREVTWQGKKVLGSVSYTAPHAAFLEYGTGILGMGTYPFPLPTEGVPLTGQWIYDHRHVNWRGMPSQAYLRPAIDMSHGLIMESFRAEGFSV